MGMLIVLIVVVIPQVGLYVKTSKIVYFALCQSYFNKVILKRHSYHKPENYSQESLVSNNLSLLFSSL